MNTNLSPIGSVSSRPLSSVTSRPAKERAYEYVKSRILNMTFNPGQFLTESEIAESLQMSRTPVREAFLMLEADRFLQLLPKKGAFIPPISVREMEEVMQARLVIELFAADSLIARRAEIIVPMQSQIDIQKQLQQQEDSEAFIHSDQQFHVLLVGATQNTVLVKLLENLRGMQLRMGIQSTLSLPERMQQSIDEHTAIMEAIQQADIAQVQDRIRWHIDNTLGTLLQKLQLR